MPIDDSKLAAEYRGLRGPVKFRLFSLVSMPAARSVSYTHLTLPTIILV